MNAPDPTQIGHTILDENAERSYWRDALSKRPYYEPGAEFEDYESAYRTGYEGYGRYGGRSFEEVEFDLKRDWERNKGSSRLTWERARQAIEDAWHRMERAIPGDADRDGR